MKTVITLFLSLIFVAPNFGQPRNNKDKPVKVISEKDSITNFIKFIDTNNAIISNAYDGLALGLKAKEHDSMIMMLNQCNQPLANYIFNGAR